MTAAPRLSAEWLNAPDSRAVIAALSADGQTVRFVGGCVRNALLGKPVADIDIATPDPPERVLDLLARARIRAVPTGLAHGTVTAVVDHNPFEITTLRRDVQTFGRHAEVAFTEDWAADAARRDFTMNALYADPDGTLYDPVGGLPDLQARRVRFIGDAHARIREDFLRILRFFRVHAWYGAGPLDETGLAAIRSERDGLRILSAERIRDEILKLLRAENPLPALAAMRETGVLDRVLPEAGAPERLARLVALHGVAGADVILRLAALVRADVSAREMESLADRLRLSNAEKARLAKLAQPTPELRSDLPPDEIRRAVYRLGLAGLRDRALLAWAADAQPDADGWRALLDCAEAWQVPDFPLGGGDLMALGVAPGPAMGRLLREAEDWWIARDFEPDAAALRAFAAGRIAEAAQNPAMQAGDGRASARRPRQETP